MSRKLAVTHETEYRYATRVEIAHHLAHLFPLQDAAQQVDDYDLAIEPAPSYSDSSVDAYGNVRTGFDLYVPHESLTVRALSHLTLTPGPAPEAAASPAWSQVRDALRYRAGAPWQPEVEFTFPSPFVSAAADFAGYAGPAFGADRPLLAGAIDLMHRIHADFTYEAGSTEVNTPVLEVLRERRGVCQDFAHLMIACLRALGLPARYVSGYLLTEPAAGTERLLGADASHAWVSVWCPHNGWVDLDPTNALVVGDQHVRVAVGRDYGDVMPLRGVIRGGGEHTLRVAVSVVPLG
jgi:transglutaminase-like putative cysteine protease